MGTHIVAEKQRKLLAKASRSSNMDMNTALTWGFTEKALGQFRIVRLSNYTHINQLEL